MNKSQKLTHMLASVYEDCAQVEEALHPKLDQIINSTNTPVKHKLSRITSMVRQSIKNGEDTGLQDDKPKKGSSRAVFFPKQDHQYKLDGQDVKSPSVVKIAFSGKLDKYNKSGRLLGEHQNAVESDHYTNTQYGIISKKDDGSYVTNHEHGVLAPHFGAADDHDDYVHQGRVDKFNAKDFREATKTSDFPKGITHEDFHDALMMHHAEANGNMNHFYGYKKKDHLANIQKHPFVEKMQDFVANTGQHPGDLRPTNMGIWNHPVTGKKYPVVADYGYSTDVAKHYQAARMNERKANGW